MKHSERFVKRLREELKLDIPEDWYIERTYAGHHQKSAGAWSSSIRSPTRYTFEIGLYVPILDLLKCPNLEVGNSYGLYVDCGCKGFCKGLKKRF